MSVKVCYDVTKFSLENHSYDSRIFTVSDFETVLKNMFISRSQFTSMLMNNEQIPNELKQVIRRNVDYFYQSKKENKEVSYNNQEYYGLDRVSFNYLLTLLRNENSLIPDLFQYRVLNFLKHDTDEFIRNSPIFDFYYNNVSNLFFAPKDSISVVSHENKKIPSGNLILRVNNPIGNTVNHIDVDTKIHKDIGLIDTSMKAAPWALEHYTNMQMRNRNSSEYVYLMSPLLDYAFTLYDKLLLSSKQKNSWIYPRYIKDTLEAFFDNSRDVVGMNKRYRYINNCYIKVVPAIETNSFLAPRYCNFDRIQDSAFTFSYGDVVSGSSADFVIDVMDYKKVFQDLRINEIVFSKEENTMKGIFPWINKDFSDVINANLLNHSFCTIKSDGVQVINNHVLSVDLEKGVYKTIIPLPSGEDARKKEAAIKKINVRIGKVHNNRTYLFDPADADNRALISRKIGDYSFQRDVNYFSNDRVIFNNEGEYVTQNERRNALVAFVDNDIKSPSIKDFTNYSVEEMEKYFYSLRGVACEGFFNPMFLKQSMLVHRTTSIKCDPLDLSPDFKKLMDDKSLYEGVTFNGFRKRGDLSYEETKQQFIARYYKDCECGGYIVGDSCRICSTPKPESDLKCDYWVDFDKDFTSVRIDGIDLVEDSVNVRLVYSIPLANVRLTCEEYSKMVAIETGERFVGYLNEFNSPDLTISNVNVPLDGIYYSLGAIKTKTEGINFAVLRAYHALTQNIKFSSSDCVNQTNELNEFLKSFKKSKITCPMYNPETGRYEPKQIDAWVGIVALGGTEVSQEFNKSRTENERRFNKADYGLYNLLGFDELNEALFAETLITTDKTKDYRIELLKIAKVLNLRKAAVPSLYSPKVKKKAELYNFTVQGLIETGIRDLTENFKRDQNLINVSSVKRFSLSSYIQYSDYRILLEKHPLFINKVFEDGFIIRGHFKESEYKNNKQLEYINECLINAGISQTEKNNVVDSEGHAVSDHMLEQVLYFPPKAIFMQMFEFVGDNNIRVNEILAAYFSLFESLATWNLNMRKEFVSKARGRIRFSKPKPVLNIIAAINKLCLSKDGLLNKDTNIAVPRAMSKQLTDEDCPSDVVIVASDKEYRRNATRVFAEIFPDREQDWSKDPENMGWCWLSEDVFCFANRQPVLMEKQSLNIKRLWSKYKADQVYDERYGYTFQEKHPGTKGIFLNSVFVVLFLEADVDGDTVLVGIPYKQRTQKAMSDVFDKIKNFAYFDKDNKDEVAKLVRDTYLVPSIKYLIDEASALNFKLDILQVKYSQIKFGDSLIANFSSAKNKANIGYLTTSLWFVTYFLDFYIYNYDLLLGVNKNIPVLSKKDKYEILFVFQYLLAQLNGVRAMKDDGFYGEITADALIKNRKLNDTDTSRQLLNTLIVEYRIQNEEYGISVDLESSINKLYQIFDNLFIVKEYEEGKQGFGYVSYMDEKGNDRVIDYKSSKWLSIKSGLQKDKIPGYKRVSPLAIDFYATFLLINGRDTESFVSKYTYGALLSSLKFGQKEHMNTPLFKLCKDIFES